MQNCVKKDRSTLTWYSQPQAVAQSTVRACLPHACSQWTLSTGLGSCSGSGWACGPSRRWRTDLHGTRIHTGHVHSASCQVPWGSACGLACCQDSQFILQQVEEREGVVKTIHEQHVVLVGDLRVLHEMADNTAC